MMSRLTLRCYFHPVFIGAMIVVAINNLILKPGNSVPMLSNKLSDIGIMIFLPMLICLGFEFFRFNRHTFKIALSKKSRQNAHYNYAPSHALVVFSIILSGLLMTLLQVSDMAADIYYLSLSFLNDCLFLGRSIAKPVKDLTDLISLPFLLIPYNLLKN